MLEPKHGTVRLGAAFYFALQTCQGGRVAAFRGAACHESLPTYRRPNGTFQLEVYNIRDWCDLVTDSGCRSDQLQFRLVRAKISGCALNLIPALA